MKDEIIIMQTKIFPEFWSDADIETKSPDIKLAALWMMTNPELTIVGWCKATTRVFVFQTGLPESTLQGAIKELPRCFIATSKGYWVRNYLKYQLGFSQHSIIKNNCFVSIIKNLLSADDQILNESFKNEYPLVAQAIEERNKELLTPSKGACKGEGEGEGDRKGAGGGTGEAITAEQIYSLYPRKVGKPMALKAIRKALAVCPPAELLKAVVGYAQAVQGEDPTFIPHPATWFNQERFNDHPSTWIRGNGRGKVFGMKPAKRNPSLEEVLKKDAATPSDSKKYGGEK